MKYTALVVHKSDEPKVARNPRCGKVGGEVDGSGFSLLHVDGFPSFAIDGSTENMHVKVVAVRCSIRHHLERGDTVLDNPKLQFALYVSVEAFEGDATAAACAVGLGINFNVERSGLLELLVDDAAPRRIVALA